MSRRLKSPPHRSAWEQQPVLALVIGRITSSLSPVAVLDALSNLQWQTIAAAKAKDRWDCVSRVVRDQVRDKLAIVFEDMENIARPVRAYRVLLEERVDRPSILSEATAPRALPDRPSIAVLPFNNVSGDPGQEYFVEGITEDIITALSKWRWFLVIARNSTFAYKGQSVDLKDVGRDLGVRYRDWLRPYCRPLPLSNGVGSWEQRPIRCRVASQRSRRGSTLHGAWQFAIIEAMIDWSKT